jgi:hypothetical protein
MPRARLAHDFVWRHARHPFDVCVYELTDTPGAAFIWPYLLHYPGIVRLRSLTHRHRGRQLQHERRAPDSLAEGAFGVGRIPLLASRLAVVADPVLAGRLQDRYPEARVRSAPICVAGVEPGRHPAAVPMVAVTATTHAEAVHRAAARARGAGSALAVRIDADARAAARDADIVIALPWPPPDEPPVAALLAMAAGRPAIVHETALTAAWPALDPQTWQPRGIVPHGDPVVVSIDPRDEEHSLMLALRRLAAEPALRARLGAAAHAWWQTNATPAVAAAAWRPLLEEAATLPPPTRPPGWPAHLQADGTERTRAILAEFGVTVDFLNETPTRPG